MFFTSVSGHLLGAEFGSDYKNWQRCDPVELFDAPIEKRCLPDYMDIKVLMINYMINNYDVK